MKHGSPSPTSNTNSIPFCWPSWYPSHADLHTATSNYSYYCGFFTKDAQTMIPHKNAAGYLFTFDANIQQNQDGYCVSGNTSMSFLCHLQYGKTSNIHFSKSGGRGTGMKDSSPKPLYDGELPYCWPSSLSATSSSINYYCGFFTKNAH